MRKYTQEDFIAKATETHGNRYSYESVVYIGSTKAVTICCSKHGEFSIEPRVHISGTGCKMCANELMSSTAEAFIAKALQVHGDKYTYSDILYRNKYSILRITCDEHGDFLQEARAHLRGSGCPQCAKVLQSRRSNTEEFISKAYSVHSGTYSYQSAVYNTGYEQIEITCKVHGSFWQTANDHLRGSGCPQCARNGFDKSKPGTLYYLKILDNNSIFYKIGITNRTVRQRFQNSELEKITIVKIREFEDGAEAYNKEQEILKMYKEYKYIGEPILLSRNTEIFTIDVLELGGLE
jgi:hypothetical protein